MKFVSILKLSFTNLRRRKLRSFLTILGVSIAIGMLFFLVNTAESVKRQVNDFVFSLSDATRIQVYEKPSDSGLLPTDVSTKAATKARKKITDQVVADLEKINNVKSAYPQFFLPSNLTYTFSNPKENTTVKAALSGLLVEDLKEIQLFYKTSAELVEDGRFLKSNSEKSIVLEKTLAQRLKAKVGDSINIKVLSSVGQNSGVPKQIEELNLANIGIIKDIPQPSDISVEEQIPHAFTSPTVSKHIYDIAPPDPVDPSFPDEFQLKKGEYDGATVFVDNIKNVRAVEKEIKGRGFEAISVFTELDAVNKFILILQGVLTVFSLVGILIALIGISNTMFMSVLERTREIGILKALGACDTDIHRIFLTESAAFGFLGAVLGILVSSLFGFGLSIVANFFVQSKIQQFVGEGAPEAIIDKIAVKYIVDPKIALGTVLFAIIIAIIAGFLPARQASRLDPVQSLKYE
ncbi:MAG: hypothetical protein A2Z42_00755 [Candidatus Woykebacteria bacterium RBG_19FT_COMBO_43_10]|uniref:ABC3 transporter permease protein domain-containing protein n=1 Tax=Candidatus Woykebacteria bacterium RBG_19FT_COMBO_43_10 TaxID=1802598 RepID=A0A1G1WIS3_9BACT|nr:MAG: hypothetical protein A2Z42_00755 [Candidatus Woykebacteria bacterium RBG_19FT_COMBO_43_10]